MPVDYREVIEGIQYQGEDESIAYTLDVTAVGSSPTSISVEVKDVDADEDVTDEVMPVGGPAATGNVITLPPLTALTAGRLYRVEVKYTVAGNVLENYVLIQGQE